MQRFTSSWAHRSLRCDYLDPALAWTGVKNSGRGISLSKFGEKYGLLFNVFFGLIGRFNRLRPAHTREVNPHEDQDIMND